MAGKSIHKHLKCPQPVPLVIAVDMCDRTKDLNLNGCAGWFVNLVVARLADKGKHIDDLTVKELRELIQECTVVSNEAASRKLYGWAPL